MYTNTTFVFKLKLIIKFKMVIYFLHYFFFIIILCYITAKFCVKMWKIQLVILPYTLGIVIPFIICWFVVIFIVIWDAHLTRKKKIKDDPELLFWIIFRRKNLYDTEKIPEKYKNEFYNIFCENHPYLAHFDHDKDNFISSSISTLWFVWLTLIFSTVLNIYEIPVITALLNLPVNHPLNFIIIYLELFIGVVIYLLSLSFKEEYGVYRYEIIRYYILNLRLWPEGFKCFAIYFSTRAIKHTKSTIASVVVSICAVVSLSRMLSESILKLIWFIINFFRNLLN